MCAHQTPLIDTPLTESTVTPPHLALLRYVYPATSLWPAPYLQAFRKASEAGPGSVLHLSRLMVVRDLREGKIKWRSAIQAKQQASGYVNRWEWEWEGVQWVY
jgi:hypothetical protein